MPYAKPPLGDLRFQVSLIAVVHFQEIIQVLIQDDSLLQRQLLRLAPFVKTSETVLRITS